MNIAQRITLVAGLIAIILMAAFPPWVARVHAEGAEIVRPFYYAPIFAPPVLSRAPWYPTVVFREAWYVAVDFSRLLVQEGAAIIATAGMFLVLKGASRPVQQRPPAVDAGNDTP